MFTGIISHLGTFIKQTHSEFTFVTPPKMAKQVSAGSSIAINGVCLTVKKKEGNSIYVDVMPETLKRTILGNLKPNTLVNLEQPITTKTFLAGHILQGHIDGVAKLEKITKQKNSHALKFSIPNDLSRYIVEKGSVAVNGISLTVMQAEKNYFTVGIIPYTWTHTMLQNLKVESFVNIEVDILAKYVEKLTERL